MKYIILSAFFLSFTAFSQNYSKGELVKMSLERLYPGDTIHRAEADMSDITREWNRVFDAQNLKRDRFKKRSDWTQVFPIRENRTHRIEGKRIYYGFIPKKYRYDILEDADNNQLVVNVRIHFYPAKGLKNIRLSELNSHVTDRLQSAEDIWNSQAPENVVFDFEVVNDPNKAHYSLRLVNRVGALYDKFIVAPVNDSILAHELGHMMGLDEEYALVTSNAITVHEWLELANKKFADRDYYYTSYQDMRCNLDSIMCLKDTVYDYHFNHILGRMPL